MIKPIETKYGGCKFRSRLEARWAVFFDKFGIEWSYEHEGYDLGPGIGYYLPDFWFPNSGFYAEIKPRGYPLDAERAKCRKLAELYPVYLLDGDPYELGRGKNTEFYLWLKDDDGDVEIHHLGGVMLMGIFGEYLEKVEPFFDWLGSDQSDMDEIGKHIPIDVSARFFMAMRMSREARF